VDGVTINGKDIPYVFRNGHLKLDLSPKEYLGEVELTILYHASFSDKVPENPVHTEDPTYGVAGVISEVGTLLLSGAGWYPYIPGARSSFLLEVQGPAGYEAVTTGKRLTRYTREGKSVSTWKIPPTLRGISLSAGSYVIREKSVMDVPVYTYFFPEDDHLAEKYLNASAEYLLLYSELFGPYPFEKFAVVENFFPTGYGFGSYTLLGRRIIRMDFILETSLGHEVAHAWWGNGVLVDYEQGNWSEGITAYVADHLFEERKSPKKGREHRLKLLRDFATLVPPEHDFPLKAFSGRFSPTSRAVGYGKGAMVFHMARQLVGEEAFWGGLKDLFLDKCFERVSWADFAHAFGRRAQQDLGPFFSQWVSRKGAPSLVLKKIDVQKNDEDWRVAGLLVQEKPYYRLEVPLQLETEGPFVKKTIPMSGREAPFSFRSPHPPKRLVGDPEVDIFRRLHPMEIPPTVNGIKGSTSLVAVIAESLPTALRRSVDLILASLGQKGAIIISEGEAKEESLKKSDILYLGLPADTGLFSHLPEGFFVASRSFEINGHIYDQGEDALFAVFRHPQEDERVVALFFPLGEKAFSPATRKIPHYGKYSYLAFRNGVNKEKGIWPVTASPMIFSFEEVSP
jgi:hypothetical protein